jgi:N-acetylmuramic acid 6-phosphate etherase
MSDTSVRRSDEFLAIADQFKLGVLVTESSHPVTADLSETAKRDISAALGLLFDVDRDVVSKYREFVESGRANRIAATILESLANGGKLYFTGCGSTGRLSIQLVSIWRDFWQKRRDSNPGLSDEFEDRAFSVMAGGDFALIKAVEGFEDFTDFGKKQIGDLGVCEKDVVFAITEGGETSFVIGTAWKGVEVGAKVYFVYNNPDEVLRAHVRRSREVIDDPRIEKINLTTGPMAITGSTRMQATTIQLCVMLTVLELVVAEIVRREATGGGGQVGLESTSVVASVAERSGAAEAGTEGSEAPSSLVGEGRGEGDTPRRFLNALIETHANLRSRELREQLARLVAMEESVYRHGHKNNYYADRFGIDMLTDTTERSPTFSTPPFRKFDDTTAAESWAFLYVNEQDTEKAWRRIIKRKPVCVEWTREDIEALVPEDKVERTYDIVAKIGYPELMRFKVGLDGLRYRPPGPGDSAVAIISESEKYALLSEDGFFRKRLDEARAARARTGMVYFGGEPSISEVSDFLSRWNPECIAVLVPVPHTGLLLDGVTRAAVKMLLNALSTCTMVRLGRVMGNVMIWLVPSNLKLIDRSTRYISKLTDLPYEEANKLLFEVIEYIEPRWKTDQAYPPAVGVSVVRHRHGLSNEEAEKRLYEEMGL